MSNGPTDSRNLYFRPTTLAEAWRLKADFPEARFAGGGTDLLVKMRAGRVAQASVISLRNIPDLQGIEHSDAGTRIGGSCTISRLLAHDAICEAYPILRDSASRIGSAQIRSSATVAGNLCNASPCADLAPPLLVLEAVVLVARPGGERRVPLCDFFAGPKQTCLEPHEVVTAVEVPVWPRGARGRVQRRSRVHMDLALVSVTALLTFDGDRCTRARLAAGSVSPLPLRLTRTERAIEGQRVDEALLRHARRCASEEVAPIGDVRSTAAYRRHLTGVFVERAVQSLAVGSGAPWSD